MGVFVNEPTSLGHITNSNLRISQEILLHPHIRKERNPDKMLFCKNNIDIIRFWHSDRHYAIINILCEVIEL